MSYDISLYDAGFLRQALSKQFGDWTGAPPLPPKVKQDLVDKALSQGFTYIEPDPGYIAFLQSKGRVPGAEYELATETYKVSLIIFSGEATFSIPNSEVSKASIELAKALAKDIACLHHLGIYDPQEGEAWFANT